MRPVNDDVVLVLGRPDVAAVFGTIEGPVASGLLKSLHGLAPLTAWRSVAPDVGGGLVRLSAESQALITAHGPALADGGGILGVVRGADGRFAGVLSFENATNLATMAPQLSTLVGALAVQAQLSVIERKLDDLQADVTTVIRDGQMERLAGARAALDILADVHSDVARNGTVSDDDWVRLAAIEHHILTLHHETRAQLAELVRTLSKPEARVGSRVVRVAAAVRNDRARFWFEAHVIAEAALTRWEELRLERLIDQQDVDLAHEAEEARNALLVRGQFIEALAGHLAAYVDRAGTVKGFLDRVRFIKRARLERLILELDEVLTAYGALGLTSQPEPDSQAAGSQGLETLPPPESGFDWDGLVAQVTEHARRPVHRVATATSGAASAVGRAAAGAAKRLSRTPGEPAPDDDDDQ